MSNWRDRITPEQVDWDYLTDDHFRAARMAGVRVASVHDDPMCDADDFAQDALLYMAAYKRNIVSIQHQSVLVRHLVGKVSENNRAAEKASKKVVLSDDMEEYE